MSTNALDRAAAHRIGLDRVSVHWAWLAGGYVLAFALPFVLADVLEINRDVFYGILAAAVLVLLVSWSRSTGYGLGRALTRHWIWAVALGAAGAALLAAMVVRTEDATSRPDGPELVAAVLWRGVVYGATDGLLLSVFPILVVFAAFAGSRLDQSFAGKVAIGVVALVASLGMTAIYHSGYSDFRSSKVAKPMQGDLVWSVPTLATLNPVGAPLAHVGLHVSAVLHSYETDTYLPPHD